MKSLNILVIEDEEAIFYSYNRLFSNIYNLHFVSSISETKTLLSENKNFHLVLLDLGLTDGCGLELLPLLMSLFKTIVITSANENPEIIGQLPKSLPFLLKPSLIKKC